MRLINVETLQLEEFADASLVKYAILSHRWEEQEVLYDQITTSSSRDSMSTMKGFYKVAACCTQAAKDGLDYAWVDTCCIDKSSSAELQEAINSMFRWYQEATVCYVYLSDVFDLEEEAFKHSQWFKRGWTLQELLAPAVVRFYGAKWHSIGDRKALRRLINQATEIPDRILKCGFSHNDSKKPCIAEIMSWAAGRKTTRVEDRAYSLLGLFNVNIPMLYGEGLKSFERLQEEILRRSEDQTIFAWQPVEVGFNGLLAKSPDAFSKQIYTFNAANESYRRKPHVVTNEGIFLELKLVSLQPGIYLGLLNLAVKRRSLKNSSYHEVGILLKQIDNTGRYVRVRHALVASASNDLMPWTDSGGYYVHRQITVVRDLRPYELKRWRQNEYFGFRLEQKQYFTGWTKALTEKDVLIEGHPFFNAKTGIFTGQSSRHIGTILFTEKDNPFIGCRVRKVLLGFDFDFNPICFVSSNALCTGAAKAFTTTQFTEHISSFSKADIKIASIEGGEGGNFSSELVGIRMDPLHRLYGTGIMPGMMRAVIDVGSNQTLMVQVSRTTPKLPWDILLQRFCRAE